MSRFTYDLAFSYSAADNEELLDQDQRWADTFVRFLEIVLEQVLRRKPKVLVKKDGGRFSMEDVENSALLLTLMSPKYVQAEDDTFDIEQFFNAAVKAKNIDLKVEKRCFKVVKYPVPADQQPAKVRALRSYDFYTIDHMTEEAEEFIGFYKEDEYGTFWLRLTDLAYDMYEALVLMGVEEDSLLFAAANSRKAIFLADVTVDLVGQRNILKRELQRHGYRVVPESPYTGTAEEVEKAVLGDLKKATMAVHMVGDHYGQQLEGSEYSLIDLQNKLGATHAQQAVETGDDNFFRLVWVKPKVETPSESLEIFVENLNKDAEVQVGTDILRIPLEDFKGTLRSRLDEIAHTSRRKIKKQETPDGTKVYLIYDKEDSQDADAVRDFLQKEGLVILEPDLKGDLDVVRQKHLANLTEYDAAILLYGGVSRDWVEVKLADLVKAPGFGRRKATLVNVVLETTKHTGPPPDDNDDFFVTEVIPYEAKPLPEQLVDFVNRLKN